jgi:hypothetical protein
MIKKMFIAYFSFSFSFSLPLPLRQLLLLVWKSFWWHNAWRWTELFSVDEQDRSKWIRIVHVVELQRCEVFSIYLLLAAFYLSFYFLFISLLILLLSFFPRPPIHYDQDHNFFVHVSGRKRFVLYPPYEWRNLYIYPRVHPHWYVRVE